MKLPRQIWILVVLCISVRGEEDEEEEDLYDWWWDEAECPTQDSTYLPTVPLPNGAKGRALWTPPGIVIAPSTIPGAGSGVMSYTYIRQGTVLAEYEGEVIINKAFISDYAWTIWRGEERYYYVDAREEDTSNWVRYINCSRHLREENVLMIQCYDKPFYVAKRDIYPGEELLVYYGENYAKTLDIDTENYKDLDHDPQLQRIIR